MRPVLDAVRLEPLVARGRADEAFEIAARMQALSAPIRRREQRHGDLVPLRRARLVIVIIEWMGANVRAEIAAVRGELLFAQSLRSANEFTMHTGTLAALAGAVLHGLDLHVIPVGPEGREHAAM